MKTIRLAIIGTGGMAHAHAGRYSKMPGVRLVACADVQRERAEAFAARWNIPGIYTDYQALLDAESLDGVSIVASDRVHAPIALAALKSGVHVLCEKPLATTVPEARAMLAAARRSRRIHMVNFSYRDCSGLAGMAAALRAGRIGELRHVDARYLQSWLVSTAWGNWKESPGWLWRLSTKHGSAGVLGDLGSHLFDMLIWLCGDIASIDCRLQSFPKGVRGNRVGPYKLDANDSFAGTVQFRNGALGAVQSSRWTVGHNNSVYVAAYGTKGALRFDLDRDGGSYEIITGRKAIHDRAWKVVPCKPVPSAYHRFVRALRTGRPAEASFREGLRVQECLAACVRSDELRRPVDLAREAR
jgi:predicted dehydrogenase